MRILNSLRLFYDDDPSSKYLNSSILLPNSKSSSWISFYISPSTSDKARNNEVLQQIISYFPTLQSSFAQIKGIFAGSLLKLPIRWSPMHAPYIAAINSTEVAIAGVASNADCTLYWIAVSLERPAYDAQLSVGTGRIRYLVAYDYQASVDSACTTMTLNDLSISCNGSLVNTTNLTADIVSFDRMYQLPSPEQVKMGLDMNNYKAWTSGKSELKANERSEERRVGKEC